MGFAAYKSLDLGLRAACNTLLLDFQDLGDHRDTCMVRCELLDCHSESGCKREYIRLSIEDRREYNKEDELGFGPIVPPLLLISSTMTFVGMYHSELTSVKEGFAADALHTGER